MFIAGHVKASELDTNSFPTGEEEIATFNYLYVFVTGSKNIRNLEL
jgi:hypothetical protein